MLVCLVTDTTAQPHNVPDARVLFDTFLSVLMYPGVFTTGTWICVTMPPWSVCQCRKTSSIQLMFTTVPVPAR